jgi:hypothetical protein
MAKFILVSRDKEDLYVNVDQVRVLQPQSGGGGTTDCFRLGHIFKGFYPRKSGANIPATKVRAQPITRC